MAIKQQLSAVGLYLAIIMILYGQKEVLNEETYKANKDLLEAEKREKKINFGPREDQTTYTFEASKKKAK